MRLSITPLLGLAALLCTTVAPASQKPCRDRSGKIIACPKPKPTPAPARCKDDKGRFVACKAPSTSVNPS